MTDETLPDPRTPFGARVRERLAAERLIWLTTTGADGTPQPNPVWFLWADGGFLLHSRPDARRLTHTARSPLVSLHFNSAATGNDVTVFRGRAHRLEGPPPPHELPACTDKYGEAMTRVSGGLAEFGAAYSVPLRVDVTGVRGF
jgi:PPOX class probable F420-dependent enzyme